MLRIILLSIFSIFSTLSFSQNDIDIAINPTCVEGSTGSIIVGVNFENDLEVPQPPYSFIWTDLDGNILSSSNEDINAGHSELLNLPEGEYCLFVESLSDECTAQTCGLIVESVQLLDFISITNSNCICSPGMDGSVTITISPDILTSDIEFPLTINITGPDNYTDYYIIWTPDGLDFPYNYSFNDITSSGDYNIVVSSYYGCEINLGIPIENCELIFPYIEGVKVNVIQPSGDETLIYKGFWIQDDDCIKYDGGSIPTLINNIAETELEILFKSTEPLDLFNTSVSLPGLPFSGSTPQIVNASSNTYQVGFTTGAAAAISGEQQILITGKTLDGRELIDLREMSNDLEDCVSLPQLSDDCTPFPIQVGTDDVHIFEISCMMVNAEIVYPTNPFANDGTINLTIQGVPPYTVSWYDSNEELISNAIDVSNLKPGEYCVKIEDASGCKYRNCWTLKPCQDRKLDFTFDTTCPEDETGSICAYIYDAFFDEPSDALYDFNWTWNGGEYSENSVSESCLPFNLPIGQEVCVFAKDLSGCNQDLEKCVSISNNYTPLSIDNIFINGACGDIPSGSIFVTAEGGKSPYKYIWNNGVYGPYLSGLSAGDVYTVTIIDACEESITQTIEVSNLETELVINPIITNSCSSGNTGAIELEIIEATNPLSYQWNNGLTTQNISSLTVGSYSVTITDGCDNTFSYDFQVEPFIAELSATFSITNACDGGNVGAIDLIIIEGTEPLTYQWNTGATTQDISSLNAGVYSVTITDDCNNSFENNSIVVKSSPLQIAGNITPFPNCDNLPSSIQANVTGGTGNYSYAWSNGETTQSISDLPAGTYTITTTDLETGCGGIKSFDIEFNTDIIVQGIVENDCNKSGGTITLSASGGTMPYTYNWSNGANTVAVSDLEAGDYSVTVNDAIGCTGTQTFTITSEGLQVNIINIEHYDLNQFGEDLGSIDIEVLNGSGQYNYEWSNGETTQDIYNLLGGIYTITVIDILTGCVVTTQVPVICQSTYAFSLDIPLNKVFPCDEPGGGGMTVVATSPYANAHPEELIYSWSGPAGSGVESINEPTLSGLTIAGEYCVTVTDYCGNAESICQSIICPCPEFRFQWVVDDCSKGPAATIEILRIQKKSGSFWTKAPEGEYHIYWPFQNINDVEYSSAFVDENGVLTSDDLLEIELEVDIPTTVCVRIYQVETGCSFERCVTIFNTDYCIYSINSFTANTSEGIQNNHQLDDFESQLLPLAAAPNYFSYFINKIVWQNPCTSDNSDNWFEDHILDFDSDPTESDWEYLQYFPNNPAQPCSGGGKIKATGCNVLNPSVYINIPSNTSSLSFSNNAGTKCLCVFPPELFVNSGGFNDLLDNTIWEYFNYSPNSNSTLPEWMQNITTYPIAVRCEDENDSDSDADVSITVGVNDELSDCAVDNDCPEGCEFLPVDDGECNLDLYCGHPSNEMYLNTIDSYNFCYVEIDECFCNPGYDAYKIFKQCSFNECTFEEVYYCDDDLNGCLENPNMFGMPNITPDDLGYYTISEIKAALSPCETCISSPLQSITQNKGGTIQQTTSLLEFEKTKTNNKEEELIEQQNILAQTNQDDITISPNPFSDEFKIKFCSIAGINYKIELFNIVGKRVHQQQHKQKRGKNLVSIKLDASLENGLYELMITDDKGERTTYKVLKIN